MSFEKLKRNKKTFEKLKEAAKQQGQKQSYNDDRFWKPTVDKAGNGFATIRWLPVQDENGNPWITYWDHGFQGPTGKWYIEKSRTSIGQEDPVADLNSKLWNTGVDADKETARNQKRRLHYVANILVVNDPQKPECNGKVFLYKYGKKIQSQILDAMDPQYEDEEAINPFDMWSGANFKLKIRKVEGWPNYDKSEFESPSPIHEDDDWIKENVYDKLYDLNEFLDPATYKTYDELKAKLDSVLGTNSRSNTTKEDVSLERSEKSRYENDDDDADETSTVVDTDDDDEILSEFRRFVDDD